MKRTTKTLNTFSSRTDRNIGRSIGGNRMRDDGSEWSGDEKSLVFIA